MIWSSLPFPWRLSSALWTHFVPTSPRLTSQSHLPSGSSLKKPRPLPWPQGLCTGCSLCLDALSWIWTCRSCLCFSAIPDLFFSFRVVSDSLWPHGLQHARPSCPSYSLGVCPNSCPLSRWCHPTISSYVTLFCPQSFPASGSFPMSQLFASGGQSIGASASASALAMNIQVWSPLG